MLTCPAPWLPSQSVLHHTYAAHDAEQGIHVQAKICRTVFRDLQNWSCNVSLRSYFCCRYHRVNTLIKHQQSSIQPTKVFLLLLFLFPHSRLSLRLSDRLTSHCQRHFLAGEQAERLAAAAGGTWPFPCLGIGAGRCRHQVLPARPLLLQEATFAHCPSPCHPAPAAARAWGAQGSTWFWLQFTQRLFDQEKGARYEPPASQTCPTGCQVKCANPEGLGDSVCVWEFSCIWPCAALCQSYLLQV